MIVPLKLILDIAQWVHGIGNTGAFPLDWRCPGAIELFLIIIHGF